MSLIAGERAAWPLSRWDFGLMTPCIVKCSSHTLLAFSSPLVNTYRQQLADCALGSRLPAMMLFTGFAADGGLLAYGPNLHELFRRAATYVAKILQGAKPGDLPIERPSRYDLVLNLKTAKALGLTIPPAILFQADEVIR